MDRIPLESLGLEKRWPKLAKFQDDLADFRRREQKAAAEEATLRAQLPHAREQDLVAAAKALRGGKKPPEPTHEPAVRRGLEAAERDRAVLARTIQAVHEDLGGFLAVHQPAVYDDVVAARGEIAERLAEHARAALSGYQRYEDLGRVVKDLRPAEPVDENAPAQRLTNVFAGFHTTGSVGPPRGDIEAALAYLASLGGEEEGANSAA